MLSGRDGTKMIGPLDSTTVIDKIEGGEIDTDSSMISFSPLGFDTPLWEPISLDKVIELYKIALPDADSTECTRFANPAEPLRARPRY